MPSISHYVGGDILLDGGAVASVSGSEETRQLIYRGLLTLEGSYLWDVTYGVGAQAQVGLPTDSRALSANIQSFVSSVSGVDSTQPVSVTVTAGTPGLGQFTCNITYVDLSTQEPQYLSYPNTVEAS